MSYTGQRSLAALAAILLVYSTYFVWASAPGRDAHAVFSHMAGTVIVLVIVLIALEIGVTIITARTGQKTDERDRAITARAARNGYFAVFSGLWVMPLLALAGASPILLANCLLGLMVFAEAVHFASCALYSRTGG